MDWNAHLHLDLARSDLYICTIRNKTPDNSLARSGNNIEREDELEGNLR